MDLPVSIKRESLEFSFVLIFQPRKIEEIKDFLLTARRKDAKCKWLFLRPEMSAGAGVNVIELTCPDTAGAFRAASRARQGEAVRARAWPSYFPQKNPLGQCEGIESVRRANS